MPKHDLFAITIRGVKHHRSEPQAKKEGPCDCGSFQKGFLHMNQDAFDCKNCGGWMSGLRMPQEGLK